LQIIQTALAACVAWFLAILILGIARPTFAPIAAVIALGLAVGERVRRAVELTLAVAFGVAMADLLVSVVGVGAVQAGAVVLLAMGLAVFLGGGDLGVKEAAISALIIMITFRSSQAGFPLERFLEALIGGTALLINALLPVNPERMVEDAAFPVFAESAAVLEEVADALEDGDAERVQRAYVRAREIDARLGPGDGGPSRLPTDLRRSSRENAPVGPKGRHRGQHDLGGARGPGEKSGRQRARRPDPLLSSRPHRGHRHRSFGGPTSPGRGHRSRILVARALWASWLLGRISKVGDYPGIGR
jgi:hypothetical protein